EPAGLWHCASDRESRCGRPGAVDPRTASGHRVSAMWVEKYFQTCPIRFNLVQGAVRSEERRVGKEGSCGVETGDVAQQHQDQPGWSGRLVEERKSVV